MGLGVGEQNSASMGFLSVQSPHRVRQLVLPVRASPGETAHRVGLCTLQPGILLCPLLRGSLLCNRGNLRSRASLAPSAHPLKWGLPGSSWPSPPSTCDVCVPQCLLNTLLWSEPLGRAQLPLCASFMGLFCPIPHLFFPTVPF